jgi:hypothetical protein
MAVVLGGSSDPEVDFFISLHLACSAYSQLPRPGGIFDQDSYLMYGLLGAAKAFREKEAKQAHEYNRTMADMRAGMRR